MHVSWPNTVGTDWSVITVALLLLSLHDLVNSLGHGNNGNSPACQNLSPSQLERRLRDEGEFDHRYMAADLEAAVDKFSDLADAKFMRRAEVYTCDAQCLARTEQIRSAFAKYGQIPTGDSRPSPSFADVREMLEGRVGQVQSPSDGLWSGALFPNFAPFPGAGKDSHRGTDPAPALQLLSAFPPLPLDAGFPLAPQSVVSQGHKAIAVTSGPDDEEYTDENGFKAPTPRSKQRRTKVPQGGFKWLTPGDLGSLSSLSDLDDSDDSKGATTTKSPRRNNNNDNNNGNNGNNSSNNGGNRRRPRAVPVNSTSIGQGMKIRCSKKGQEEQSGLHLLCGSCRIIRELPSDYFPRYLNEVACAGQTCFDRSTSGGSGGGRCVEQLINFDILRNVGTSDCQKWTTYTVAVPVCCSCMMSDSLAQFLAMPWAGQSLSTSGPARPDRGR